MSIERKIGETFWVLIDTEPEQYGIKDSKWTIKEINLSTGSISDISTLVNVQELIDSFTPWTTTPLVNDLHANKGDRRVRIDNYTVDEVNPGERFYFHDSTSIIYKIIAVNEVGGGNKVIKLDRRLEESVANNTALRQVGNTGSYRFSHSIGTEGDYSIEITCDDAKPLIDLKFGLIKIRDFNMSDIQENFDSMDSTVIETLDRIKGIRTKVDALDLDLNNVAKDTTSVEILTRIKSIDSVIDEMRDDILGIGTDRSRILL